MKCRLGDCMTFKNGKKRPITSGIYPVYGGNGVLDYTNEYNQENSVIIGRVGAYCGSIYFEKGKHWVSDNAISAVAKKNSNMIFDYYLLKTLNLNHKHIGTSQPLLTQKLLNEIEICLPPLSIQYIIADTLSALDNKIAVNKKINHHLEQIAQAIFKSWFVDFEPFGGVMPDDWREGTLSDICSYNAGRVAVNTLTLDTYISTENMSAEKGGFVKAASLPTTPQTTAFAIGDTLVSNIRPYFKKIVFCGFAGGCSTDVLCFRPNRNKLSLYVYNLLYSDRFFDFMVAGSKGTKMPRGDKQQIMSYHIAIPTDNVLDDFIAAVTPMTDERLLLTDESIRLAELRDALLPRLMSGELSVADLSR